MQLLTPVSRMLRNSHWGSSECTPILPITTNGLLFLNIFSLRGRIWSHGSGCQEIFKSLLLVSISELNPHPILHINTPQVMLTQEVQEDMLPSSSCSTNKHISCSSGRWPCPSCPSWGLRSPLYREHLGIYVPRWTERKLRTYDRTEIHLRRKQ